MPLQKVPNNPGVYKDDTALTAEGFFIDADKVRFRRGLPETMGGWELLSSVAVTGLCRGMTSWADNSNVKWLGIGTHTNVYAFTDSLPYDITPITSRSNQVSISFTTVISSAVVTADWTAHGLVQGQAFKFANATVTTVGGVTINTAAGTTTTPSPWYIVLAVNTANQVAFTAAQTASSSAGPTASTVDASIFLAPGLANGIGALGFSTGVYSTGSTYSSPATGAIYPRTWSIYGYGQNLLASPRGGAIYEFAPAISNSELVTNGTFTGSATGWALGTAWAYSSNAVVASNTSAALTQTITTPTNAFCTLQFDVAAVSGTSLQVSFNSISIGSAITTAGRYIFDFFSAGATASLAFTGTSFFGTIDNVSVKQTLSAVLVPNAPTQNNCMLVTAEGFVMVGGTTNATTGIYDPMLIRWSDIGSKASAEQTWTPASSNLSSFSRPLVGSRIVAMKQSNNEVLVWTDKALYALAYVGTSALVYSTRLVGIHCGLIGANAVVVLGGTAYWMTPTGSFYQYSGGAPTPIPSGIQKDVFDNISLVQQDKIFASPIAGFNDVIWLYPDRRDGNECSRYALLCTQENAPSPPGVNLGTIGVFAPGTFDRTAWTDAGVYPYPIAVSSSGYVYYHEKGQSADGGTFTWLLKHGAVQTGDGNTQFMVDTLIPDFKSLIGGATYTAYSYLYPQSDPVTHGPFNITASSDKVSLLSDAPVGREIVQLFQGSAAPAGMRAGHHMFDLQDTGMTF